MTTKDDDPETEQFEAVLEELRVLMNDFRAIGVGVVLVGGQVLSLEARAAGGRGVIEVRTRTDVVIQRGYSMEPDLLFDVDEAGPRAEQIPDLLKAHGFRRVRTYRWSKKIGSCPEVLLDLFMPPDADEVNNPAGFTRLPAGDLALLHSKSVSVNLESGVLEISVPLPVGFLAMKLEAKLRLRPGETKDCFDMYAYVAIKGADMIARALASDMVDGPRIRDGLMLLFADVDAPGVRDVLAYAGTLGDEERALLARAVVELFEEFRDAGATF